MAATAILQLDARHPNLFSAAPATLTDVNGTNIPIAGAAYNDTTVQDIFFEFKASKYLSGNITAKLTWYSTTAQTTGAVVWGTQMAALAAGAAQSVLTDTLATANSTTTTVSATASGPNTTTVTISNLDSLATDGNVQLRIFRDASNGADTMTGNALLYDIELSYLIAGGAITNAGSGTDNAIVRFDLNGQAVQNSVVLVADTTGAITGPAGFTVTADRFIGPATGLRETLGPTDLVMGNIITQQILKRSGSNIQGIDLLKSYLAADSAGITTTLTDVCNITLQSSGQTYLFEYFMLLLNSTATGNVVTMQINYTGTVTNIAYDMQAQLTATAAIQAYGAFNTNTQSITFSPASTALYVCKVKGSIVASSNGQLAFRISRATSGNVVAKIGSYMVANET